MSHPLPDKSLGDLPSKPGPVLPSAVHVFCAATLIGAVLVVLVYGTAFGITSQNTLSVVFGVSLFLTGATVAAFYLNQSFPHQRLGLCNLITLGRLGIVGVLCAVMLEGIAPNLVTFAIAILALVLDGIDGWLARMQGLASEFGARFDVEVDALFALVLAIYAATNGAAGPFVILLGLPHYLFWIARLRLAWLNQPLRPSFSRKAVCVFQIGALIALQIPALADGQLNLIAAAVSLALLWSFGRDIVALWQTREARP